MKKNKNSSCLQSLFVLNELTSREIKRKYARSVLGVVWSVLNPLLSMTVISLAFGVFLGNKQYPVYYGIGYTIWGMFNTTTKTAMSALVDNRSLVFKTKLPRIIFVISRCYTELVNTGFSFLAVFIIAVCYNVRANWLIVLLPLDIIMVFMFTLGISLILSTIYVFYKNIQFIWRNICVLVVHMVAIYIPIERYPESVHVITRNNPMFIYPDIARNIVLNKSVNFSQLIIAFLWAIISLFVGMVIFRICENSIVKKIG